MNHHILLEAAPRDNRASYWPLSAGTRIIVLFIVVHAIVWTLAPAITRYPGGLWDDMLENYAWAREWQLGYYKHPPFYAWIVGLWFLVFPREEWAYYLLSATNVAAGLFGIWALAGRFLKNEARILSVLLLTFMPYYNYMASNFNANTVLLSLWPWTVYAFVRSIQSGTLAASIAFGALGAAGLLSKYYSILLLVSCFAASLAHPAARRYYASPAPYVAIGVAALLCLPHVWWAIQNDFPPVMYALGKTGQSWVIDFYKAITTAIASLAINGVAALILVVALSWRRPALFSGLWRKLIGKNLAWILFIACGPFLITILLGAAGYIKVAVNFLIPAFFMLPMIFMIALEPAITRQAVRGVISAAVAVQALAIVAAPIAAYTTFKHQIKGTAIVSPMAARDAARHWHDAFHVPLRIVSGSELYSLAQVFYTHDTPSEFTHFNLKQAPWITKTRIDHEGLLVICETSDESCLSHAKQYATSQTRYIPAQISRTEFGIKGPDHKLIYVMTPPQNWAP